MKTCHLNLFLFLLFFHMPQHSIHIISKASLQTHSSEKGNLGFSFFCVYIHEWMKDHASKQRENEKKRRGNNGSKCANYLLHKAFFTHLSSKMKITENEWTWRGRRKSNQARHLAYYCSLFITLMLPLLQKKEYNYWRQIQMTVHLFLRSTLYPFLTLFSFLHYPRNKSQEYKLKLLAFYQLSSKCWESLWGIICEMKLENYELGQMTKEKIKRKGLNEKLDFLFIPIHWVLRRSFFKI